MITRRWIDVTSSLGYGVMLLGLPLACKDDDPCDPGQEERPPNDCYPVSGGSAGAGGSTGEAGEGDSDSGAPAPGGDFEFGQPCADSAGSSDCGGIAPICVPLPSGSVCTQALCLDGEPNAGVCPAEWPCTAIPGFPSACLNL
jgi:hypothetical protein